jgi:hypothetical protein
VPYSWTQITSHAPFTPRDGAGALSFSDRMWLIGGWNPRHEYFPNICVNDVWSSIDGQDWSKEKANTFGHDTFDSDTDWEGRHTAGYAVLDGRMWIVGGDCNQGHYQNDVWSSEDGRQWTCVTRSVPWGPRAVHHTVAHAGYLWVIGGQTIPQFALADEVFHNDTWRSRDGIDWECVNDSLPLPQRSMIGGSAVHNDRIWMLGGGTYDTPATPDRIFLNDVWSTADGLDWTCHTGSAPWHPRQYHEVAVWDDHLWVLEGYHKDSGNRNDVWYSPDGITWHELPDTPWEPRHAASVFVHDDALWMVAGNNMESDVWKLSRSVIPA